MRRIPWDILFALLAGLGLGLGYAWMIAPQGATDTSPVILRADFKDQFRSTIAAAYAATGNLPRAQARIAYLEDTDPVAALNTQAQQMLASGDPFQQARLVAALAVALDENGNPPPTATGTAEPVTESVAGDDFTPTVTLPPPPPDLPINLTETPQIVEPELEPTQSVSVEATLRPTRTPVPTFGAPFKLTGQDTVCDSNLPDGLLQVIVNNRNRRQVAGIEIVITWDGGGEQFFTGFKPEIGNGYADFIMSPNVIYSVQLARGSDIVSGLTAPTCQASNGENFLGGIKLTFQQP